LLRSTTLSFAGKKEGKSIWKDIFPQINALKIKISGHRHNAIPGYKITFKFTIKT